MKFSEKIVRLRKIKGITQDEFASAVGVSRQAVYKWECGQSYPEASKLIEIKALFGISIDDLLDDSYEVALPEKKKRKRVSRAKTEKTVERVVEDKINVEAPSKTEENESEEITVAAVEEEVAEVEEVTATAEITEATEEAEASDTVDAPTVVDEAESIIEEIAEEKQEEAPAYTAAAPIKEEPVAEAKEEVKKRGFFSRLFGRK